MGNTGSSKNDGRVHSTSAKKQIDAGDLVPNVTLKVRIRRLSEENKEVFEWRDVQSFELFRNKKVVMFAIAGDEFIGLGVDEIYCIAVNDAFVIRHFGLTQGLEEENEVDDGLLNPGNFKRIRLIPDGSARFTRAMGMSCRWDNMAGFGERSWRYSAYIDNGKVIKMFKEDEGKVEDDSRISPAQLLVADGTTMLTFLKDHLNKASAP